MYGSSAGGDEVVARVIRPLHEARGWMKLLGVLSIIAGVVTALTVVGLVIAWLPIWVGVLLNQAANKATSAHQGGSETEAVEAMSRLKTVFTIYGVLALIYLVVALVYIVVLIGLLAGGGIDFSP